MTSKAPPKAKLVERLVTEGFFASLEAAEKQIRAGLVRVNGEVVDKPGTLIGGDAQITLAPRRDFVGRGALKLAAAFEAFPISAQGGVCADVGACTGGFTEVLLLRGANKVYAIDVGYGDLDWKIRTDPRVVVMERTNVRYVEQLPDRIDFVTIDVSFISLTKVLPVISKWLVPAGTVVALVKPQFEAQRREIAEGGIVQSVEVRERVVSEMRDLLPSFGLSHRGTIPSPILGAEGNQEYLLWAECAR